MNSQIKIERDRDWLWVYFPSKPDKATREALIELGGRWSSRRQGWYFTNGDEAEPLVKDILSNHNITFAPAKLSRKDRYTLFERVYALANKEGIEAAKAATPTPMVVYETAGLSNRPKEDGKSWYHADGACGLGWVNIKPGTSSFARWAKRERGARKAYRGGVNIYPDRLGQSLERNKAWAGAFADVLRENLPSASELDIWARSRID